MSEQVRLQYDELLRNDDAARLKRGVAGLGLVAAILLSCWMTGAFDLARFADSWPAIKQLSYEMVPPDFGRWRNWLRPIADTLAMSVAGTALAVLLSLPIALLAAHNTTPNALLYRGARLLLICCARCPNSSWESSSSPWWDLGRSPACLRSACIRSAWSENSLPRA
jgi:ABC-type phosphate/phosphonate transport system permease subunit